MTKTAKNHPVSPCSSGPGVRGCSNRAKGEPWTGLSPTVTESNPGGLNHMLSSSVEPGEVPGQGSFLPYHRSLEITNLPKAWSHRMSMDGVVPLCITSEGPFFTARGHRFRGCRGHLRSLPVALNTSGGSFFQAVCGCTAFQNPARGHGVYRCGRTGSIDSLMKHLERDHFKVTYNPKRKGKL